MGNHIHRPQLPISSSTMKLGFVVLAHDNPDNVIRLVSRLTEQGGFVALHWDARNQTDIAEKIRNELPPRQADRVLMAKRHKVHWGLWSVVAATLSGIQAIKDSGQKVDYVVLLSGHDYPLRRLDQLASFLAKQPWMEHIECIDHTKKKWVTDGLHDERWQYRHYISWRENSKWFDRIWKLQRFFGLKVRPPKGIKPHFGSQWWALSWPTLDKILVAIRDRKIRKFFRRTWVPDEMFFQTMVAKLVPPSQISGHNLHFYHFDNQGVPLVFYNDHLHFLQEQPHFFARKIGPRAHKLRDAIDTLARSRGSQETPPKKIHKQLHRYEVFHALQYRGVPNRRVIGAQRDLWWGDMENNKRPYTAIFAPKNLDLSGLWQRYAAIKNTVCYGDLFEPYIIGYGNHAQPHPLYPSDALPLRDLKKPNFLFDIIQTHPRKRVVFTIRVPCHTEIPHLCVADPHCDLVFVMPESHFYSSETAKSLCWNTGFHEMVLADLYWQARKNGKQPDVVAPSQQNGEGVSEAASYLKSSISHRPVFAG